MGLFSKIASVASLGLVGGGLSEKFRTGTTAAGKAADAAAQQANDLGQQTLAQQQQLQTEIGGIYNPTMEAGNQAFGDLASYYQGDQQPIIDQAMQSPFMSSLVSQGENAIARNAQMTGAFRSGTTQENLAQNSQNVLMSLVDQVLQGKQGIANAGFGATDAYSTAAQNIIAGQGATRGQIAGVDIATAAGKQNQAAGKQAMYGNLGGSLIGAGATAFSDKRLKKNIVKIGEKNDLPWYSWDWNDKALELGLTGSDEGHIAQEVQKVRPELVVERGDYLAINYGGF
tara:strand:+ start:8089 stop:8946 length:858 start_codon:yes stop_codon:yes gene_type:complete